jgi:hypothetical protein
MKSLFLIVYAVLFLVSGCTSNKTTQVYGVIQPGSIKANSLALTADDLRILNKHNPQILKKIDRGLPVNLNDIVQMQILGISADSMLLIIEHTASQFHLTTSDVIRLQTEGVPFKVINRMIQT